MCCFQEGKKLNYNMKQEWQTLSEQTLLPVTLQSTHMVIL